MKVKLALVLVAALAIAPAALAVETHQFTPQALVNPPKSNIDVVGLVTGMTADEVKKTLEEGDLKIVYEETKSWIGGDFKGARVKTTPFLSKLFALVEEGGPADTTDKFNLSFSSPASGGQLIQIDRENKFTDPISAPPFEEFLASLKAKYGEPTILEIRNRAWDGSTFVWSFKDGKLLTCPGQKPQRSSGSSCDESISGVELGRVYDYSKKDYDLRVRITIIRQPSQLDKVRIVNTQVDDLGRISTNSKADYDSLVKHAVQVAPAKTTAPRL